MIQQFYFWVFPWRKLCNINLYKAVTQKDIRTPMIITGLFTIAKTWKQPRYPSTAEWIKKLWYIYTREYYSAIRRNAFESVLMRWMNWEPIIWSGVSQKEKDKYSILTYIWNLENWYWRVYLQGSDGETDIQNTLMDVNLSIDLNIGWLGVRVTWYLTRGLRTLDSGP